MNFSLDELRPLALLEGLPDEQLDWLCRHGRRVELEVSEHMFELGTPADAMWIVVEGEIRGFEEHGGQWLQVATTGRGEVTGMLPFSRMTHYPRYTMATEPSIVLRLDTTHFRELLDVSEELGRRLVAEMSDRVRGDVRLEQQSERMIALGRLSAGLAHELNNPAAAMRRASARLTEQRARLPSLVSALLSHDVQAAAAQRLLGLRTVGREAEDAVLSPLDRSDLEDRISDWLEGHGVHEPWDAAGTFSEVGLSVDQLSEAVQELPPSSVEDALLWLAAGIESDRLVGEIASAAKRISELVASVKIYSHMDRSPEHKPTDVRMGLDNTLTMLGHDLKRKAVRVRREYQPDLPLIPANAGELNQVWTNLIGNAIDAIEEGGEVALEARENDRWLEVEVIDDGPGIPEALRTKIFEPFFTTKPVGEGTGLGLGIADRIVKTHRGHIEVRSRPGETAMCVRLPLA